MRLCVCVQFLVSSRKELGNNVRTTVLSPRNFIFARFLPRDRLTVARLRLAVSSAQLGIMLSRRCVRETFAVPQSRRAKGTPSSTYPSVSCWSDRRSGWGRSPWRRAKKRRRPSGRCQVQPRCCRISVPSLRGCGCALQAGASLSSSFFFATTMS